MDFFGILKRFRTKYLTISLVTLLFSPLLFGQSAVIPWSQFTADTVERPRAAAVLADDASGASGAGADSVGTVLQPAPADGQPRSAATRRERRRRERAERRDSQFSARIDTLVQHKADSSAAARAEKGDTTSGGSGLDEIISGSAQDSVYYDMRGKKVYIYNKGDVTYQDMNLKADYMRFDMEHKEIYAYGRKDTVDGKETVTHPEFSEGSSSYTMDTITYNIDSKKAKIKGVATQQGDGWLVGGQVKKMPDNTVNLADGMYTTCDETEHPHFYVRMPRAKVIPGKKIITGPAYLVLEDVPIYPLMIPEGFFPINMGPRSGILMPTYGEEASRGFFIRDLGYYFTLSPRMDLAIRGGIYTLGSWEASATSRYIKRYKYSGNLDFQYSSVRTGEKGQPDFIKQQNFSFRWTHQQDPKANPGSTFSASVNFATSGYSRYSATTLNDRLNSQTNSAISYSRNWAGTPFSLSASMSISQNSQNATISMSLPNLVFNVSRIYPFKRREPVGKPRWYEKISMQYTGKLNNQINTTEKELFKKETLKNMRSGVQHTIPVSGQFNVLKYINLSPSFNYDESWYFRKQEYRWNPAQNKVDTLPMQYGFWRQYRYSTSLSASTTIYGMYRAKNRRRKAKIQAIRHTLQPTFGFSYTPDFSKMSYGFLRNVQIDSTGRYRTYSPYAGNLYQSSPGGASMAMNFSLSQTLEMKVLSDRDTSGVRKIKLIDDFRISGNYNLLADSMGLSNISVSIRSSIIKNFGLNINMVLCPYRVTPQGKLINKLFFPGRVVSTGWTFGYNFNSRKDKSTPAINDVMSNIPPEYTNPFYDPYGTMDPVLRRQYMSQSYYDFSMPWNIGFNYTVNYSISYVNNGTTGYRKNINQNLGFTGGLTITPKTSLTFTGGFDIMRRKLTTSSISITRDLHCWQMSFMWVPFGTYRSWSFNIGVKAASLSDLKYDKSQSMYDNLY